MTRRHWKITGLLLAGFGFAILGAGWLADYWLESSGGRRLLERELGAALGSPVRLEGDYRFRLLPRIRITGEDIRIGPEGQEPVVGVGDYQTVVGLVPLLRGELRIDAVELHNGEVDVARLGEIGRRGDGGEGSLPEAARLKLSDIRIRFGSQTYLNVVLLELRDFGPDRPVHLATRLQWIDGGDTRFTLRAEGNLGVAGDLASARLEDLQVVAQTGQSEPVRASGHIGWRAEPGVVELSLRVPRQAGPADIAARVAWQDGISGSLQLDYPLSAGQSGRARVEFRDRQGGWILDPVELSLGEQTAAGTGCFRTGPEPYLGLSLRTADLDLDRLRTFMPAGGPGDQAGEQGAGGAGSLGLPDELPIGLGIELRAERVRLAGTVGETVDLVVGSVPDCPITTGLEDA